MPDKAIEEADTFEQLKLDLKFVPRLIVDADSRARDSKAVLAPVDAVSITDLGLDANAKDWQVAQTARLADRLVYTSDRSFHYDAYKGGGQVPPGIVVVPQNRTDELAQLTDAVQSISWEASNGTLPVLSFLIDPEEPLHYELDVPPPSIREILPELDERGKLSSVDLAYLWSCKRTTACKRARQLVAQQWLYVIRRGRENRYCAGQRLNAFRKKVPSTAGGHEP